MKFIFTCLFSILISMVGLSQFTTGWIPLPSETSVSNGATNGMWFTAPANFIIKALMVPDDAMSSTNPQSIAVLRFDSNGVSTTGGTNYDVLFLTQLNYANDSIPCNVQINNGDIIGVIGSRFNSSSNVEQSSNTTTGSYSTTIGGNSTPLYRLQGNSPLGTQSPSTLYTPTNTSIPIVRMEMYLETCIAPEPTSVEITELACFGDSNASITAAIAGNNAPYVMEWSTGDSNINNITNLGPGDYTLYITDSLGCIGDSVISIIEPDSLNIEFDLIEPLCFGEANGQITANAVGGTPPFLFDWGGSLNGSVLSNTTGGTYMVTVTDSNSCEAIVQVTLEQPAMLELVTDSIHDVTCPGDSNGEFWVITIGGTLPYTYLWNDPNGQTSPNALQLKEGEFTLTATDINGCVATITDSVRNLNESPVVDLGPDVGLVWGSVMLTAPSNMTTYLWSNSITYQSITVTQPGIYWVMVVDSNGCSNSDTIQVFEPIIEGVESLTSIGYQLVPNPTSSSLMLKSIVQDDNKKEFVISFIDGLGRVIKRSTIQANEQLDMSDVSNGIYTVLISSQTDVYTTRLVVSK